MAHEEKQITRVILDLFTIFIVSQIIYSIDSPTMKFRDNRQKPEGDINIRK